MWETEQFWGTIDFHSIFFSYYGSQWCPKTAWLQTFFKISSFVFGRTKKLIEVWNYSFPVAQMVEHGAINAKIMGSIPRESKSWSNEKL